eukprot:7867018-Ditylum_brightwellii.AAC.1
MLAKTLEQIAAMAMAKTSSKNLSVEAKSSDDSLNDKALPVGFYQPGEAPGIVPYDVTNNANTQERLFEDVCPALINLGDEIETELKKFK